MEIKYLYSAIENMAEIKRFLDEKDTRLAVKIIGDIKNRILELESFPLRWPKYTENSKYRVLGVHNYLVFYTVDEAKNTISIYRILHGARNISSIIKEK